MIRKLRTPVLAMIVALSTVSVIATPNQAVAENAFVVGQTYQTSSGNFVNFVGYDRNGQAIFAPIARQQSFNTFRFSSGHRSFNHRRSFSRHNSFRGHRGFRSRGFSRHRRH